MRNWFPRIQFTFRYINNRDQAGRNALTGNQVRALVRQHGVANANRVPQDQAADRIREVFPQMSNTEIERELRRAGGNPEIAII